MTESWSLMFRGSNQELAARIRNFDQRYSTFAWLDFTEQKRKCFCSACDDLLFDLGRGFCKQNSKLKLLGGFLRGNFEGVMRSGWDAEKRLKDRRARQPDLKLWQEHLASTKVTGGNFSFKPAITGSNLAEGTLLFGHTKVTVKPSYTRNWSKASVDAVCSWPI